MKKDKRTAVYAEIHEMIARGQLRPGCGDVICAECVHLQDRFSDLIGADLYCAKRERNINRYCIRICELFKKFKETGGAA
jgi:hypothetical protein